MKKIFAVLFSSIGFLCVQDLAAAQAPVAVVEDVKGKVTGAEFMDYVLPGKVIKLGPDGVVILSYLKTCSRETISGIGTVIVGEEESMVHLGDVKANKVPCDLVHTRLIGRETGESAATVVRAMDTKLSPRLTLFGLSPLIESGAHGKLVVERLDVKGERYDVELTSSTAVRGRFYDFAKTSTALKPGGIYSASVGSQRLVFLVDRDAQPGRSPIIGRLVRLQ
jgi:hypothetical protein